MNDCIGYVVVEYNQASHQAERVASDSIHWDRQTAEDVATYCREETAKVGRGERYVVAEVREVEASHA